MSTTPGLCGSFVTKVISPGHLYLHMIHKGQLNLVHSSNPVTTPAERQRTAATCMRLQTFQFS